MSSDEQVALCEACGAPLLLKRHQGEAWLTCSGCGAQARLGPALVAALDDEESDE